MRAIALHVPVVLGLALSGAACDDRPAASGPARPAPRATVTVFAAASTTEPLQRAAREFESQSDFRVEFSFEASSTLARQIKAGAHADIFISADEAWMDELETAGELEPGTRHDFLGNELVIIVPSGLALGASSSSGVEVREFLLGVERLAVGDPEHVPAGRYTEEALRSLGVWERLAPRLLSAANVRAALRLVEMGEADAGIVYATDARSSSRVRVVAPLPPETHGAVRYPVALCRGAGEGAREFLTFLVSATGARTFEEAGFRVLTNEGGAADDHR